MNADAVCLESIFTTSRALLRRLSSIKMCLLLFCMAMLPVRIEAQTQVFPEWVARHVSLAPGHFAIPSAIAADSHGNTYVTGMSFEGNDYVPDQEILTIKYDSDGHPLWKAWLKSPVNRAQSVDIALDAMGNVYVLGMLYLHGTLFNPTDPEIATLKYNSNGVRQWANYEAPPPGGFNSALKLLVSRQGDVFVTGTAYFPNFQGSQILTIKYKSSGKQSWERRDPQNTVATNEAAGMGMDAQGNIYVAANSSHTPPMIYKYDEDGTLLKAFDFGTDSGIRVFYVDHLGNSYAAACYGMGPLVAKFDSQGNRAWMDKFTPARCYENIQTDKLGNVILAQTVSTHGGASSDLSVLKLDANGVQKWETRLNGQADGSGRDSAGPLAIDSHGNVYVAGFQNTNPNAHTSAEGNMVTIKYSPAGQQIWQERYSTHVKEGTSPRGIAIGGDGGLFVTGDSTDLSIVDGSTDWVTIDYVQDAAKLTPSTLTFGGTQFKRQSSPQSVTLTNTAAQPLPIAGIATSGDFDEKNNCPSTLYPGESCTISVMFTPNEVGKCTGTLTVRDAWEGSPQKVKLTGVGVSH